MGELLRPCFQYPQCTSTTFASQYIDVLKPMSTRSGSSSAEELVDVEATVAMRDLFDRCDGSRHAMYTALVAANTPRSTEGVHEEVERTAEEYVVHLEALVRQIAENVARVRRWNMDERVQDGVRSIDNDNAARCHYGPTFAWTGSAALRGGNAPISIVSRALLVDLIMARTVLALAVLNRANSMYVMPYTMSESMDVMITKVREMLEAKDAIRGSLIRLYGKADSVIQDSLLTLARWSTRPADYAVLSEMTSTTLTTLGLFARLFLHFYLTSLDSEDTRIEFPTAVCKHKYCSAALSGAEPGEPPRSIFEHPRTRAYVTALGYLARAQQVHRDHCPHSTPLSAQMQAYMHIMLGRFTAFYSAMRLYCYINITSSVAHPERRRHYCQMYLTSSIDGMRRILAGMCNDACARVVAMTSGVFSDPSMASHTHRVDADINATVNSLERMICALSVQDMT